MGAGPVSQPSLQGAERREAALLAASQERRNRPLALLALAGVLLLFAAIFAGASVLRVGAARRAFETRSAQAGDLLEVAARIEQVRAGSAQRGPADRYAPERNLLTKLQAVSDQVGFARQPTLNPQNPQRLGADSPLIRRLIEVTIGGASPEDALRWIDLAETAIPGLFVTRLELRPDPTGWTFRITLARWEIGA